jgi:hypothetical protein
MDIQTVSALALSSVAGALMVLFGVIERYDSRTLLLLLTVQPRPYWAMWLLNVTATLFAPQTALKAMRQLLEMAETAEMRSCTSSYVDQDISWPSAPPW